MGPIPGHHNGHLPDHWTPAAASAYPSAPPGRESLAPPAACPTPTLVNGVNQSLGYFSPLAKVYMNDVIDHLEVGRIPPMFVLPSRWSCPRRNSLSALVTT